MRDHETIETALHASETGHLVFSTLHTLDATETINRIIAVFPPHQQKQIRMQLAAVLKAVVSQRLIPRADGKGRAPACEVMITTPFIRDCIVDKEKTHLIHSAIAAGTSQYGMQTFDQADLRAVRPEARDLRRGAALGDEQGRVQAQGPGHLDDVGRDPRRDGALGDGPEEAGPADLVDAASHPLRALVPTYLVCSAVRCPVPRAVQFRQDPAASARHGTRQRQFPEETMYDGRMRARQPRTPSDTSPAAATTAGLVLLGRRELTASQLRERLLRKGYPDASVAEAIDRLTARGLIDDARAAGARARHGVVVHRRGRARVLREVKSLGVPDETARRAVAAAFDEVDEDRMVAEALQRKLRGAAIPKDARDRQRLYGWLLRQGFDAHRIQRVLKGVASAGWDE